MTSLDDVGADEFVRELDREPWLQGAARRIVECALKITAADDAVVSLRYAAGRWDVAAASSNTAAAMEAGQHRGGDGPAWAAAEARHVVLVSNCRDEGRWSAWMPLAASRGVQGAIAACLHTPRKNLGTVSVYSRHPGHFTPAHVRELRILADRASIKLERLWHQAGAGSGSHCVVDQAQHLLMDRYGLDADTALDVLQRHAAGTGTDLMDVAGRLIATCGDVRAV